MISMRWSKPWWFKEKLYGLQIKAHISLFLCLLIFFCPPLHLCISKRSARRIYFQFYKFQSKIDTEMCWATLEIGQGRFQSFGQGSAGWRAKRAENFIGGCQPLIYKLINRGLTYDLIIVIYHLLKI